MKKKTKIYYVAELNLPSKSAYSIHVMKMCEAFSELDNEVMLITTNVKVNSYNIMNFYNVKKKFTIKKLKQFEKFPLGINYYLFSLLSPKLI